MRRTFISIAILLSAAQAAPAFAADDRCTTLPGLIRTAAATAEPALAKRALQRVSLGERLCEARNKRDAAEQFRAAARDLGLDEAQVKAATPRPAVATQGQ